MDIQYIGEHLIIGQLGKFAIVFALLSAFLSSWLYFMATRRKSSDFSWASVARKLYYMHTGLLVLASFLLLTMLLNGYYEYRYVWAHIENDLGLGYRIAAFWAGQEGSLLFWILCQAILGVFVIKFSKKWELHVMVILGLAQFLMISMLLGWNIGDFRLGMSPFVLHRELPDNIGNAFFENPEYLFSILDGTGLNPLLRNFWMLSHPPVLFVGFAGALIPFAYAIAGMWKQKYTEWIAPALPWVVFTIFFLGAGILLGGVWAYESLTFGGFWAWDPIENASLVPWLIIVAALHVMLISKRQKQNVFLSVVLIMLGYVFVVYSTYLTRSGILAETSVHSFGKDGMGSHIMLYIGVLLGLGAFMVVKHFGRMRGVENENPLSREFWLLIASLVLVLSATQIIFTTSLPVLNYLFGSEMAPPLDVVSFYNTWQMPFAIFIAILMGFTHYLYWGNNNLKEFFKRLLWVLAVSILVCVLIVLLVGISGVSLMFFLWAGLFAFLSSLDILIRFRKKLVNTPAIISHAGIALFFIAVLLTFSQKEIISKNTSGKRIGQGFSESENLLLVKGDTLLMGDYRVSYRGYFLEGEDIFYEIDFLRETEQNEIVPVFTSYPSIKLNERMGNVYNPYAKVFLHKDVFTYITYAEVDQNGPISSKEDLGMFTLKVGDTVSFQNNTLILTGFLTGGDGDASESTMSDVSLEAQISLITHFGREFKVQPRLYFKDLSIRHDDASLDELNMNFSFNKFSVETESATIEIYRDRPEFIIIKTIIFPVINLLWISCIVMLVGFVMVYIRRIRQ